MGRFLAVAAGLGLTATTLPDALWGAVWRPLLPESAVGSALQLIDLLRGANLLSLHPDLAWLRVSKAAIVPEDSSNMLSEAAWHGLPVHIAPLEAQARCRLGPVAALYDAAGLPPREIPQLANAQRELAA